MIPIQNIYYMLSYAFQVLREQGYKNLATESFSNTADLCAAILSKGVSVQIKRGLGREYTCQTESLSTPRGRPLISPSIKTRSMLKKQLVCSYDNSFRQLLHEPDHQNDDGVTARRGYSQNPEEGAAKAFGVFRRH